MALVLQLEPPSPLSTILYTKMRSFQTLATLATLVTLILFASKEAAALPTSTNSVGDLEARFFGPLIRPASLPPINKPTVYAYACGDQICIGPTIPTSTNSAREVDVPLPNA